MAIGLDEQRNEFIFERRTVFEAIRLDDFLGLINDVGHVDLWINHSTVDKMQEKQGLTPTTCLAPAFAANILRIPVPQPTSSTVFPSKRWRLSIMASR